MSISASAEPLHDDRVFRFHVTSLVFAITFTGLLIVTNYSLLQGGDTYWHLATGRWIAENLAVPHRDVFSHTVPGDVWLAKEWLSQLVLYRAYRIGGWWTLNAFAMLLVATTVSLLAHVCLRHFRFSVAVGITVIVMVFASPHYLARPHLLAYPIMMVWVMGVVFAADRQRVPSFWLLPVMTLWANMHGGFTLGLAIAGLMSIETLMGVPRDELKPRLVRHGIFLALAAGASLITPFGIQSLLITPKIFGLGEVLDRVDEWQSPDFHIYAFHLFVLLGLLGAALIGGLKLKPMRIVTVLLLTYLMLMHVRALAVFALLMPIVLARPVPEQFKVLGRAAQLTSAVPDPVLAFVVRQSRWLPVAAMALFSIGLVLAASNRSQDGGYSKTKPIDAVAFAQANGLNGPVFNDYGFGGYLIFNRIATFIDGRAELYGRDFFNAHHAAVWQLPGQNLFQLLDDYKVTWTLLLPRSGAAVALTRSPHWRCVYADEYAAIHVRTAAEGSAKAIAAAGDEACK